MHIEGAECIDQNFYNLEALHRAGLRSVGPVWSRPTIFGEGVPFAFPHSPDTGRGLSDFGKELIKNCNLLNMIIDTSHLNEKGFGISPNTLIRRLLRPTVTLIRFAHTRVI